MVLEKLTRLFSGKGRMKHTNLERLIRDRIEEETTICTDAHKSYIQFAQNLSVENFCNYDI